MGSYVDQSLTRNESVISRAQTSWIPTIIPVIIGILLLPFYGLGLLIIIPVLLRGVRLEKGNYPTLSAFFAQMATD